MKIRKTFKAEIAHLVRLSTCRDCSSSIHGHSYKFELILESKNLDQAGMVVDFDIVKFLFGDLFKALDHSFIFWNEESDDFKKFVDRYSERWVNFKINTTSEGVSASIFEICSRILSQTYLKDNIFINSVIVHETESGYAQFCKEDMESIEKRDIIIGMNFSEKIKLDWSNKKILEIILGNRNLFLGEDDIPCSVK